MLVGRTDVLWIVVGAMLIAARVACAQPAPPQVGYVYPAGGQKGTDLVVTVGGVRLDGVKDVDVTGAGLSVKVIEHIKPLSQAQALLLRDELKMLMDRKAAAKGVLSPATAPAATKPAASTKPAATKPAPATRPATAPASRPAATRPASTRPVLLPAPAPASAPASQTRPATQPASTKPAAQTRPATQPAVTRPASRPATQAAASQPATRPVWTIKDEERVAEIRKKLATFQGRPMNPAIAETVTLHVTLARDAAVGTRELRLVTPNGVTNPLTFCVGQFPETGERDIKSNDAQDEVLAPLPTVINGRIMPGDVDHFRFKATKGQKIVAVVAARSLRPYLADAVPGWFQAVLRLTDAKGHELACVDDYRFNPDPVMHYVIPADGEYVVEIKDSLYRGREDFIYRIALAETPFVTGTFPLGGKSGESTTVELTGWNLPVSKLTFDAHDRKPGVYPLTVKSPVGLVSNDAPFEVGHLPEAMEREPNNSKGESQAVQMGCVVNGRIDRPGDVDIFCFDGKIGQTVVAEVMARRLGSPMDSLLRIIDAAGKQIALNDDHEDKADGLTTHHADSYVLAKLPADGRYYVQLSDVQHAGGAEYAYRLRIGAPEPDFAARIMPSSLNIRAGMATPITVHVVRRDGFSGEIAVKLRNAPANFTLGGGRVGAGQDSAKLTLTATSQGASAPVKLEFEAEASIDGKAVTHRIVPAEDMQQAFAYRHLVPAQEMLAMVVGRGGVREGPRVVTPLPLKIPAGGVCPVSITVPARVITGDVHLELVDPPEGVSIAATVPVAGGTEITLKTDAAKMKPGMSGNLLFNAVIVRTTTAADGKAVTRRNVFGMLPAVPFDVVESKAKREETRSPK